MTCHGLPFVARLSAQKRNDAIGVKSIRASRIAHATFVLALDKPTQTKLAHRRCANLLMRQVLYLVYTRYTLDRFTRFPNERDACLITDFGVRRYRFCFQQWHLCRALRLYVYCLCNGWTELPQSVAVPIHPLLGESKGASAGPKVAGQVTSYLFERKR